MNAEVAPSPCRLQVRHLSKSFPGVQALADVGLDVAAGEVHALLGENGAGKSTLMKILAGLLQPEAGEIRFQGRAVRLPAPHHARRLGIAMIHQELLPFPHLSVAENIFMGQQPASRFLGWIDRSRLQAEARRLLDRLGAPLSPARRMGELSVAEMQTVEIAKAMAHRAELLIMDEPTSALSAHETERLFEIIRGLRQRGASVIYISHKLDEVFRLADTVTVLRDGRHIATVPIRGLTPDQLVAWMVGRELPAGRANSGAPPGEVALAVRGLSKAGRFRDVSFQVRRGEVLGFAGLMGAGRTDVVNALYGLAPADTGEILVHGRPARIRSPRQAIRLGLGLVTEDRKEFGLVLPMSVKHNLTLTDLRRCCRAGVIRHATENRLADERLSAFAIRAAHRNQAVGLLSGGNQQKVVMAKTLLAEPQILLLVEPTRGIDIGAKAEVHALIAGLARAGKAVVLVSSELPELLALSDRLVVLREGVVTAELDARQAAPEQVLRLAMPG
jgi:ABC-type sugar transport system ATPase subunit